MHSPVPQQPSAPNVRHRGGPGPAPHVPPSLPAARRAELEGVLTAELLTAVAGARRRALRDGDRQIDTAHLLHSLVEADTEAGAALGGPPQHARVLGYQIGRAHV